MNQLQIVAWLCAALTHWTPMPRGKLADAVVEERLVVARALVDVAYDPAEPPLAEFRGPDARARTALLLGSIAAHESGLLPRLAEGRCLPGECDHGKSFGLMQVMLGAHGIALIPGGGYRHCTDDTTGCLTAAELAGNVPAQIRAALHLLRSDGLRSYTGEAGAEDAPSARRRQVAAELWSMRHPVPAKDAEVVVLVPVE
ncbi:MAG: hypothetical protein KGL39_35935 [Patescibacteria group bacterium]|nr:hypothetical protein [Patescibacteria group bacterium]